MFRARIGTGVMDMSDIFDDLEMYVCITHQCLVPCNTGDNHLISNWNADVQKILNIMEKT